ncbi:MAG: hypothetical protein LQ349_000726 [Xanthoria aureola]|nr:MAG: hypothetical protein LQ349_000726 [Xanthoria aureola]
MQFQDAAKLSRSRELGQTLHHLNLNRYPHVPNPPSCKKRASVALIIRVRPTFPDTATFDTSACGLAARSDQERLNAFFAQGWVQRGDPEVLFIKRAARKGDRWTSHIAFPGGGRDPGDKDDLAASIRETREEVGMDLEADHCLNVGNLSERIVTAWLGKTPLMVLCPFVFLQMRVDTEPLALQPTEVHSAHWVSLRALTSPYLNSYIRSDVSQPFGRSDSDFIRTLIRLLFGQVLIKGIDLVPTESVYCNSGADLLPSGPRVSTVASGLLSFLFSARTTWENPSQQLILWGLTLGIMSDFLRILPSCDPSKLWAWPTLSHIDHQFSIWLFTLAYRKQKLREIESSYPANDTTIGGPSGPGELDDTTFTTFQARSRKEVQDSALLEMLGGYYDRARTAVYLTLLLRIGTGGLLAAWGVRELRNRRPQKL